jgi:hypothetical protein
MDPSHCPYNSERFLKVLLLLSPLMCYLKQIFHVHNSFSLKLDYIFDDL